MEIPAESRLIDLRKMPSAAAWALAAQNQNIQGHSRLREL
jgi:hypothetical protein